MVVFFLNDRLVKTELPTGTSLLDYIRYDRGLTGTKIGCREGDCGACTVLEGRLLHGEADADRVVSAEAQGSHLHYRSIVSCLTPLGNAHGKHIVTVEGLNMDVLSPVQQAFVDHNATQCGFCTPGFVVSLSGHAMSAAKSDAASAIASMDGNICRCTGYKSIERAAITVSRLLNGKDTANPLGWLVSNGFLPSYFLDIPARMLAMQKELQAHDVSGDRGRLHTSTEQVTTPVKIVGGGTDLMVQQPDEVAESEPLLLFDRDELKGITVRGNQVYAGAAATAGDIMHSPVMQGLFEGLHDFFTLISSDPIRNMGTIAGNLVNASPIGDLSIFFLALDATVDLASTAGSHPTKKTRSISLKNFFLDYKQLDMQPGEMVAGIHFRVPSQTSHFNFEKVSKRTHLDIASVNAAILLEVNNNSVISCRTSCGGVAPVPLYLEQTSAFLTGKPLAAATIVEASHILQQEISPISDVRGSAAYKRLLAEQLFFAHFLKLFPGLIDIDDVTKRISHE